MARKVKVVQMAQPMLLPAAAGTCPECATEHGAEFPHNAQSLFYQMKFQMTHGRSPDWRDAMQHCTPRLRREFTEELTRLGVDVAAGQINPAKVAGKKVAAKKVAAKKVAAKKVAAKNVAAGESTPSGKPAAARKAGVR
jgi:hypothetical protein